ALRCSPMVSGVFGILLGFRALRVRRTPGKKATRLCPCGYQGDPSERCDCTPGRIAQYRARVSGPLLDRIDLRVEVPALAPHELNADLPPGDSTAQAAAKVALARDRQRQRAGKLNSRLTIQDINVHCRLDERGDRVFWQSQACLGLSARSYH